MLAGPLWHLCDLQARETEREMRMKLKLNECRIGCRTRFKVRVKMSMFVVLFPAVIPFHLGCWLKFAVLVRCRACCRTIMSACNAIRRQEDFPFPPFPQLSTWSRRIVELSTVERVALSLFLLFAFCFLFWVKRWQFFSVFFFFLVLPLASSTCRAGQLVKCLMSWIEIG